MRHHVVERSRVNQHIFSIEGEREAIQASRSRAVQVFAVNMIVRTMAWTFETHTVVAKRYSTAQVNAPLVQRNPVRTITIFDTPLEIALYVTLCSKCRYFHGLWCAPAHELLLANSLRIVVRAGREPGI